MDGFGSRVDRRAVAVGSKLRLPGAPQCSTRAWWQPWTLISKDPHVGGWESGPAGPQRNEWEGRDWTVIFPLVPKANCLIPPSPALGQEDHRLIRVSPWTDAATGDPKGPREKLK